MLADRKILTAAIPALGVMVPQAYRNRSVTGTEWLHLSYPRAVVNQRAVNQD
jgi:hypothetical protein